MVPCMKVLVRNDVQVYRSKVQVTGKETPKFRMEYFNWLKILVLIDFFWLNMKGQGHYQENFRSDLFFNIHKTFKNEILYRDWDLLGFQWRKDVIGMVCKQKCWFPMVVRFIYKRARLIEWKSNIPYVLITFARMLSYTMPMLRDDP